MNYGYDTFLDVNFIRGLINNDAFMGMPIEAQILFFHLIFNTDILFFILFLIQIKKGFIQQLTLLLEL